MRARIVANLAGLYRRYPEWSGAWFGTNPLAGRVPGEDPRLVARGDGRRCSAAWRWAWPTATARSAPRRSPAWPQVGTGRRPAAPRRPACRSPTRATRRRWPRRWASCGDAASMPVLAAVLADAGAPEAVRAAALRGLSTTPRPRSRSAPGWRLIYDPNAPADAGGGRACRAWPRAGLLPPNDLASFLENPAAPVRAAALLSLNVKQPLPAEIKRRSSTGSTTRPARSARRRSWPWSPSGCPRPSRDCSPSPAGRSPPDRSRAIAALCRLPDPRAVSIYLAAIRDRNPRLRRAGESALLAIRDRVADQIAAAARSAEFSGPAALSLERVLARFEPIREWRVIGPFPRTTPQVFLGERSIDFARAHAGAAGQPIAWATRRADPATGRVDLDDLKRGAGERGGSGYDAGGSPDLCAFAYAEVDSDREGPGLMLLGSSGHPDRDRQRAGRSRTTPSLARPGRMRPTPSWCGSAWPGDATGSWS